jgi:hypothetical protein
MAILDVTVLVPIRTVSESNSRDHWSKRAKRAKHQRSLTALMVRAALGGLTADQCSTLVVSLARIAPRELDDDNLRGACKGPRDAVADALGLPSDRDPRVTWLYYQRRGKPREYAVEVRITGNLPGPD